MNQSFRLLAAWVAFLAVLLVRPFGHSKGLEEEAGKCDQCNSSRGKYNGSVYEWSTWHQPVLPGLYPEVGDWSYSPPECQDGNPTSGLLYVVRNVEVDVMGYYRYYTEYRDYSPPPGFSCTKPSCSQIERNEKNADVAAAGEATYKQPITSNAATSPSSCSTCQGSPDEQEQLNVRISLGADDLPAGAGLMGNTLGSIDYVSNLAEVHLFKLADVKLNVIGRAVDSAGQPVSALKVGDIKIHTTLGDVPVLNLNVETVTRPGSSQLLSSLKIVITGVGTNSTIPATTHLFTYDESGAYEGVKYTRTEGTESENVQFYNTGVVAEDSAGGKFGSFKIVNPDGATVTWDAPPENINVSPITFVFTPNLGLVNRGSFTGQLGETETLSRGLGKLGVRTERTYYRIGSGGQFATNGSSKKVLVSETIKQFVGADILPDQSNVLSTKTRRFGYHSNFYNALYFSPNSNQKDSLFGLPLWELDSDGNWKFFRYIKKVPTNPESEVAEVIEYSPWKEGTATVPAYSSTQSVLNTFFQNEAAQAAVTGHLAYCKRSVTMEYASRFNGAPAWNSRVEHSTSGQINGREFRYGDDTGVAFLLGSQSLPLRSRSERWNSAESAFEWSADYEKADGNLRVSMSSSGLADVSQTTVQAADSHTITESWKGIAQESGGYGASNPRRFPPSASLPAGSVLHPLRRLDKADPKGRTVEQKVVHRAASDTTVQTIATSYGAENAYTRSTGSQTLDSRESDQIVSENGKQYRLVETVDATGARQIVKQDETTGETVSEKRVGAPAANGYAAQPDVTTHYVQTVATAANSAQGIAVGDTTQTVTQTDGVTTRTLSVTVTDVLGRTKSVTDETGRVTSYAYSTDGRTTTETLPGGLTRITTTYLDGQIKSITGTAVVPEFHDYTVNDGSDSIHEAGSITETVWFGWNGIGTAPAAAVWEKRTTDFLGRLLVEERRAPSGVADVIRTVHTYNAKGQRTKVQTTGQAAMLFEYDQWGQLYRKGYDLDGSGSLGTSTADSLTETTQDYVIEGGMVLERATTKEYAQSSGSPRQHVVKRRLLEGSFWQQTDSPDYGGQITVYDSTNRAARLHQTFTIRRVGAAAGVPYAQSVNYNGRQVAEKGPGQTLWRTYTHDGFGSVLTVTDPSAGQSVMTYDPATGRLLSEQQAGTAAATYAYFAATHVNAGMVSSVTRNGKVTRYAYDTQGRLTHQWGTAVQPLRYEYDLLGRLYRMRTYQGGTGWDSETLPAAFTSATAAQTTWDYHPGTGHLWKKTDQAGRAVSYTYDSSGLLTTRVNARGITTTYDHARTPSAAGSLKIPGRVSSINYSDATPDLTFTYHRGGSIASVTDAGGLRNLSRSSATRSELAGSTGLLGGFKLYHNAPVPGQPAAVGIYIGSQLIELQKYDWSTQNQLLRAYTGQAAPDGNGGLGITYRYGRVPGTTVLQRVDATARMGSPLIGLARYSQRDASSRVEYLQYSGVGAHHLGYHYEHDAEGRRERVSATWPSDPQIISPPDDKRPPGWNYTYNDRGEVETAARFSQAGGPVNGLVSHQQRNYQHDLMGNRQSSSLGSSAAEKTASSSGYTPNLNQQYSTRTHPRFAEITGEAAELASVTLRLDDAAPVTIDRSLPQHQTGDPGSFRYWHPVIGTAAVWLKVEITVTLPAGGGSTTRSGFIFVPPATETLLYDDDGNLTEDARWTYTWDAENRLTSQTEKIIPAAAGIAGAPIRQKLAFAYDYQGRRIAKTVYRHDGASSWVLTKDLRFVYDGWNMIAELDHTFAAGEALPGSRVVRTYLWGEDLSGTMTGAGGVGGLLGFTNHLDGTTYHVCSDGNGNVTGLVPANGPDAGKLVARFDYDPFGKRITNTGPDVELCPIGFSSKYTDSETGLVYYGYRYYSPELGRWMSRDPIEEQGGVNLYGMVGNDTVNRIDVLGLRAHLQVSESKINAGAPDEHTIVTVIVKAKIHWDNCPSGGTAKFPDLAKQRQMTQNADKIWDITSTKEAFAGRKPIFFGLFGSRPIWNPSVKYDMKLEISATYSMAGDKKPDDADLISLSQVAQKGPSFVRGIGGKEMVLRNDWNLGVRLFEHEMGHVIGAEDFYIQNQGHEPGRLSAPYSNDWVGNLMADRGPNLNWRNVEDVLRFHGKKLSYKFSVEEGGVRTQNPLPNVSKPQPPSLGSFR